MEGVDGSGVVEASGAFDLPQAQSITKASAAASRAGNFTAATYTGFKIREILNAVITDKSSASLGESSLFKSQQAMTIAPRGVKEGAERGSRKFRYAKRATHFCTENQPRLAVGLRCDQTSGTPRRDQKHQPAENHKNGLANAGRD